MKLGNVAIFLSTLASVAFGHVVNVPNADQHRRIQQDESVFDSRSHDESTFALADRGLPMETDGYLFLKKAASGRTLEKGQQYAILESGGTWTGHHRVIVGIVAHTTTKAGTIYEFANTKYYHAVNGDESGTGFCCPKSGDWDPKLVTDGWTHSWLGPVKAGADPQKEGEAYLMRSSKRYNYAASICYIGNNCQTYATGLYDAIKE